MDRLFIILGALVMFIAVGAGAFGAHGLSSYFAAHPDLEGTYETAVRYQMIHGLALFVAAWISTKYGTSLASWAGYLFLAGILLFSGSLYLLVFTRQSWLGAVAPIGGVALLAGWAMVGASAIRSAT